LARPSPAALIRLFNQDIIDLTNRVPVGTHVTVVQG
jgi:lipoprotein-anchoring transpeptidase ErfK/SrfK